MVARIVSNLAVRHQREGKGEDTVDLKIPNLAVMSPSHDVKIRLGEDGSFYMVKTVQHSQVCNSRDRIRVFPIVGRRESRPDHFLHHLLRNLHVTSLPPHLDSDPTASSSSSASPP